MFIRRGRWCTNLLIPRTTSILFYSGATVQNHFGTKRSVATLFQFVTGSAQVRIEDSSRNRFALNGIQRIACFIVFVDCTGNVLYRNVVHPMMATSEILTWLQALLEHRRLSGSMNLCRNFPIYKPSTCYWWSRSWFFFFANGCLCAALC